MNYFLSLNKKFVLILIILIISLIFFYQTLTSKGSINIDNKVEIANADIAKPKFAINNNSKKIFITAEEGNFIGSNKILLKKNVKFKSNDFSIETENVIFDRNKETAHSTERSYFKTNNATIISNGFDISEKGNKIVFYGKASIILKWNT